MGQKFFPPKKTFNFKKCEQHSFAPDFRFRDKKKFRTPTFFSQNILIVVSSFIHSEADERTLGSEKKQKIGPTRKSETRRRFCNFDIFSGCEGASRGKGLESELI